VEQRHVAGHAAIADAAVGHHVVQQRADLHGELRHEGDADAGGDHLAQRLQARRLQFRPVLLQPCRTVGQRVVAQAVALAEQDQLRHRDVLAVHLLDAGEGVVARHDQDEFLAEQLQFGQVRAGQGGGGEHGVQLALLHLSGQLPGQALGQQQAQLREAGAQRLQQEGHEVGAEGGDDAEPEGALQRRRPGGGDLEHPPRLRHHQPRLRHQLRPAGRHQHAAGRALEAFDLEQFLDLADLRGQRGLADGAGLRGAAEAEMLGDREEVFEVTQRQAGERHGRDSCHIDSRLYQIRRPARRVEPD
jgi:hypothetical protein